MSGVLVSVIIPAYNAAKFIDKTIISILNQKISKTSYEIIVIDDCSSDNTIKVASKALSNVNYINWKVLKTKKNSQGPAKPRNIGIKKSIGKYIAFCDSDDIWHPEKLSIQLNELEKNENLMGLYTTAIDFREKKQIVFDNNIKKKINMIRTSFFQQLQKNSIKISSLIVRKNILKATGEFDESLDIVPVEDYDLCLRILFKFPDKDICKLKNNLTFYRLDSNSISSNKLKMFYKVLLIHIKISGFFKFKKTYIFFFTPFLMITYLLNSLIFRVILKKS